MSEYHFVEKPFLDQLRALGWQVLDQGHGAIPTDPAKSLRTSFRQLVLPEVFRTALLTLNTLPDGTPWLADRQVNQLYDELTGQPGALIEANEAVQEMLVKAVVDRNERTGEDYPTVRLIDFEHPERNLFHAINQFRIDTPGRVKDFIIPDVVLFVNGIPLVTVECKEANAFTANPLYEAYVQMRRYGDQREETRLAGLSEGEPRLFHFNQFNVITCGDAARFGSLTATEEYFYRSLKLTHLSDHIWRSVPASTELPGDQYLHSLHRRTFPRNSRSQLCKIACGVEVAILDPSRTLRRRTSVQIGAASL